MKYHITLLPFSLHKGNKYLYDGNSVIKTRIPYTKHYNYHLTEIASRCLLDSETDEDDRIIKANLNWIMKNLKNGTYHNNFAFPHYPMEKGWVGGLAQGLTISVLVYQYKKTKEKKYLSKANQVFNSLVKNCLYTDGFGNTWINEYPNVNSILNGMIYAMFGIYDLYYYTDSAEAGKLWDKCVITLVENLHRYDLPYGSRYDLVNKYPATEFYHKVHIEQMKELFKLTRYKEFHDYWKKWAKNYSGVRCSMKKNTMAMSKYGIIDSYKRYKTIKRWNNG